MGDIKLTKLFQILLAMIALMQLACTKTAKGAVMPNVCTVVNSPAFDGCTALTMTPSVCGFPPRPCVNISYNIPSYFIEVLNNPGETYFSGYGSTSSQLAASLDMMPTVVEEDNGAYSFQAHSLTIPFVMPTYATLPCGGAPVENYCFGAMSEHIATHWRTGLGDRLQPNYLAWLAAPKACLLAGAGSSVTGGTMPAPYPHGPMCSFSREGVTSYPPASQMACNGWGTFYPRYQTVTSSDQTTASLQIAARFKSLANSVFNAMPSGGLEMMQMIYPTKTACFTEGQNVGFLRGMLVNEAGNLMTPLKRNYLYAIWRRTSCRVDAYHSATTPMTIQAIRAACAGFQG